MVKNKKIKFVVTRTSYCLEDTQPCKEAKLKKITYLDCKTKKPLRKGEHWIIEIEDLKELLKFCDKYGAIIIDRLKECYRGVKYNIEIYDDYRE